MSWQQILELLNENQAILLLAGRLPGISESGERSSAGRQKLKTIQITTFGALPGHRRSRLAPRRPCRGSRMIWLNHPTHSERQTSTRTSESRSGSPDGPGIAKHYAFHCFCARSAISLSLFLSVLFQRSLIRSPSEARLCVFLAQCQWLAQYCAPDCSHSHFVRAGRSRIILYWDASNLDRDAGQLVCSATMVYV